MVRMRFYLLAFVLALGAAGPVAADNGNFDLRLGAGALGGNTTYTIGGAFSDNQGNRGEIWDPLSELKWPLNVVMVSLGARAEVGRFSVRGEIAKNATSSAGDMEDSDWGLYYDLSGGDPYFSPYSKDVFSTSSTELDALILDFRGRCALWRGPRFSTAVGLGFRYQKFSSVASDVHQYSPSYSTYHLDRVLPSDPFAYDGSGPAIDYEVTYAIPYVEASGLFRFTPLVSLEGSVGFSPLVQAEDRDDHLLRFKLSEGEGNGIAWLFDVTLRLQPSEHWFAAVGVSGLVVDTSGTQKQSYYGGELAGYQAEIDQTITSLQVRSSLEVGLSF